MLNNYMYYMDYSDEEIIELIKKGTMYMENGMVYLKMERDNWSMSLSDIDIERYIRLNREAQIDDLI